MLRLTSSRVGLAVEAPAKVNLTLRVVGVRPDGYHDLESVVAAVGLLDRLRFEPADDLDLVCGDAAVPPGDDNLVMKAAGLLRESCGARRGARVYLEKHIPAGRGFGGGSSDAAAALAGLNALWQCGRTPAELAALGARLGSDVPLFFSSPVAVMRGRGERIEPVEAQPPWWLALAWPGYGNPTADVYAAYDRLAQEKHQEPYDFEVPDTFSGPGATEILKCLEGPARRAAAFLVNDLEPAARTLRPGAPGVRALLERAGAAAVGMTGSGSAYFALADTEAEARSLADAVRSAGAHAVAAPFFRSRAVHKETQHESDERDR
ncbi:MAG: 4-(cytidine 5'-diphospho)-2-C-methyl-D-erythritol kinase [Planctomycetes bacterium]|nr:4-(cytidine 5'-diphospho)-2-C-methyl-D-erythritol kinase [Planctomycetota bacterium]